MLRSNICEKFLKINEVNCCSIIDSEDEGEFNKDGCDCCNNRLACTTYECNGYSPKNKKIVLLGQVCHDCICYFYNGDDSEIERG